MGHIIRGEKCALLLSIMKGKINEVLEEDAFSGRTIWGTGMTEVQSSFSEQQHLKSRLPWWEPTFLEKTAPKQEAIYIQSSYTWHNSEEETYQVRNVIRLEA